MEKPGSYFDWEQTFKKKKAKKILPLKKDTSVINSIGLSHDLFKNYVKLWKTHNMTEDKLG